MRSNRSLSLSLLLLGLLVAGCGGAADGARERSSGQTKAVRGYGLRIDLPAGWHGEVMRPEPPGALTLRVAIFPLPPPIDVGQQAQRAMGERDILITLVYYGRAADDPMAR